MRCIERFLAEHLVAEKCWEQSTIRNYRSVHAKWFSPEIGRQQLRDEAAIDRIFGRIRKAGRRRLEQRDQGMTSQAVTPGFSSPAGTVPR